VAGPLSPWVQRDLAEVRRTERLMPATSRQEELWHYWLLMGFSRMIDNTQSHNSASGNQQIAR